MSPAERIDAIATAGGPLIAPLIIAVLACVGLGQIIAWCIFLIYLCKTPYAVLKGRFAARTLVLGTVWSKYPRHEHEQAFRIEFERSLRALDEKETP